MILRSLGLERSAKSILFLLGILALLIGGVSLASFEKKSVEVGVAEQSPKGVSGGVVVPASCPSYEHFSGECAPNPTCSSGGPDGLYVYQAATSYVLNAYNVSNASDVFFQVFTNVNGTDDLVQYFSSPIGGGQWQMTINPTAHSGTGPTTVNVYMHGVNGSINVFCDTANFIKAPAPTCTSAGPDNAVVAITSTSHTVSAYGVTNANSVRFATWTDVNGQDDIVWYSGTNMGGGTWQANINPSNHSGTGSTTVQAYMDTYGSTNFCDTANFAKVDDSCPNIAGVQNGVPSGYGLDSSGNCVVDSCSNIAGIQTSVPSGYYATGGACFAEVATLNSNPTSIDTGGSTTLTWSCDHSSSATSNFTGSMGGSGSVAVSPTITTNYTLQCVPSGASAQTTVTVKNPTLSLTAATTKVKPGQSTTLSWSASDVTSCSLTGPGFSSTQLTGTNVSTGAISAQSRYTLVCQTAQGTRSVSTTVSLVPTIIEF